MIGSTWWVLSWLVTANRCLCWLPLSSCPLVSLLLTYLPFYDALLWEQLWMLLIQVPLQSSSPRSLLLRGSCRRTPWSMESRCWWGRRSVQNLGFFQSQCIISNYVPCLLMAPLHRCRQKILRRPCLEADLKHQILIYVLLNFWLVGRSVLVQFW